MGEVVGLSHSLWELGHLHEQVRDQLLDTLLLASAACFVVVEEGRACHQYLYQVPEEIQQSIFGNVGSWLVFRLGSSDALVLEKEFSPYIKLEQLRRQANHRIIYKLLQDGVSTIPQATGTFPPMEPTGTEADRDTVVRASKERYGRRRDEVDAKIAASLATQGAAPKPVPRKRKRPTR